LGQRKGKAPSRSVQKVRLMPAAMRCLIKPIPDGRGPVVRCDPPRFEWRNVPPSLGTGKWYPTARPAEPPQPKPPSGRCSVWTFSHVILPLATAPAFALSRETGARSLHPNYWNGPSAFLIGVDPQLLFSLKNNVRRTRDPVRALIKKARNANQNPGRRDP